MVFGFVSGVLTSGTVLQFSGDLAQVAWAVGVTEWVQKSELMTTNPRMIGGAFPV